MLSLALATGCTTVTGLDDLSFAGSTISSTGGTAGAGGQSTTVGGGGSGGGSGGGVDYAALVLQSDPLAYWRLGESVGSVAADRSPHGIDGQYQSGVTLGEPGAVEGDTSVAFDGSDDQIAVEGAFSFAGRLPFSVEAWVRFEDAGSGPLGALVSKNDFEGNFSGWALIAHPDGHLQFRRWNLAALDYDVVTFSYSSDPTVIELGRWTHVAVTCDGATLQLFIDADVRHTNPVTLDLEETSTPLLMGNAAAWANFTGGLDEVAIYDRALSGSEITSHFLAGSGR